MKRTVSAVDARQKLGEILESVYYRGDEVMIERAGKVMAVVVPAQRYESLERSRERLFSKIERIHGRNRDVPADVVDREIALAVEEARAETRANKRPRRG
jgi:prevent-host-death family protein